jgi:clan AA aspartic protease (TIGR02281 family)
MFKHAALGVALLALGAFSGCDAATTPPPATTTSIPMKKDGGVYVVPVSINGAASIDCIVDSGASDVNIPAEVYRKLVRDGKVQESDLLGTQDYVLADGSSESGRTIRIKSLKVGGITVTNVVASIGGNGSSALLGQSFLERFHSWSLDNGKHALVLIGPPSAGPRLPTGPKNVAGPPSVANAGSGGSPTSGAADGGAPGGGAHPQGDGTTVAQLPSGHTTHRDHSHATPPQSSDPLDDHLTAQHSQDDGDQ